MSNIHILDRSGATVRVVYHINVPNGNNAAGIAWTSAIVKSGIGGKTVMADGTGSDGGISSAEKTSITNGTLYEYTDSVDVPSGLNAAQLNAFLDALFSDRTADQQSQLQARLNQFGRTR